MKTLKITDETHKLLTMVKGEILAKSGDANLTYDDAIKRMIGLWKEENERRGAYSALSAYHFARFRWWSRLDLETVSEELGEKYAVEWSRGPESETEIDLWKDERTIIYRVPGVNGVFRVEDYRTKILVEDLEVFADFPNKNSVCILGYVQYLPSRAAAPTALRHARS